MRDPEWRQWSDVIIAEKCRVNHTTVMRIRHEMYPESTCAKHKSTPRKAKDGRTINTSAIGKKARTLTATPPPAPLAIDFEDAGTERETETEPARAAVNDRFAESTSSELDVAVEALCVLRTRYRHLDDLADRWPSVRATRSSSPGRRSSSSRTCRAPARRLTPRPARLCWGGASSCAGVRRRAAPPALGQLVEVDVCQEFLTLVATGLGRGAPLRGPPLPCRSPRGATGRGVSARPLPLARARRSAMMAVRSPGKLEGAPMPRPRHPNKDIERAVAYAEAHGWEVVRAGSHAWGILRCPRHGRDGHQKSVYSTPRNPVAHARDIRRAVDACGHVMGGDDVDAGNG
jgi:hypothetical protein